RPCPDGCRSGQRFPSVIAAATPQTPSLGACSPAPFLRTPARRRKAAAAAGSCLRRSGSVSVLSVFALPWLLSPFGRACSLRSGLFRGAGGLAHAAARKRGRCAGPAKVKL